MNRNLLSLCLISCITMCNEIEQQLLDHQQCASPFENPYISASLETKDTLKYSSIKMSESNTQSEAGKCLKEAGPCCCGLCCATLMTGGCIITSPFTLLACWQCFGGNLHFDTQER